MTKKMKNNFKKSKREFKKLQKNTRQERRVLAGRSTDQEDLVMEGLINLIQMTKQELSTISIITCTIKLKANSNNSIYSKSQKTPRLMSTGVKIQRSNNKNSQKISSQYKGKLICQKMKILLTKVLWKLWAQISKLNPQCLK